MRRMICLLALLLLPALLFSQALGETRIMVVSDIHYLAPELYRDSPLFLRALRSGDGKITQCSEELITALEAETEHQRPDVLIVTGDLTFNGERASHEALARVFARIEQSGTPVYVIPGNHDINNGAPRAYSGEEWQYTQGVNEEAFAQIYRDFLREAEGGADANLSYHVEWSDELWLVLADVSYYRGLGQTFGFFSGDHREWLSQVLDAADRAGVRVLTASHHSLIPHTEFSRENYVMLNETVMADLLRAHGVRLNLSGHVHIQHIAGENGLYDAALGAFCMSPHRYALVTLGEDGSLAYEARALCDEHLPEGFQEMSRDWFYSITSDKNRAALASLEIPAEEMEIMLDYSARFNLAYFSGTYRSDDPAWREDPGYALWQHYGGGGFGAYLRMVMNEPGGDHLALSLAP